MIPEPDISKATVLRASVAAIVTDDAGWILLQRRSDNGRWGMPGGGVEIGESVAEAIKREVREETGLTVAIERVVGVYSDPKFQVVRYPSGDVVHYISTVFSCRIVSGALQTCEESLDLRFFPPTELPDDVLPMHRIRIEDALAQRTTAFIR